MSPFFGDQQAIPCSLYRGGTSKAVLFLESDLPQNLEERKSVLLQVMGSPDERQIDGLGGADPLTSRVGIVSKDQQGNILFQFALVHPKAPIVEFNGLCGNILSAVGPFAIAQKLIKAIEPMTQVPIIDLNTGIKLIAEVPIKNEYPLSHGNFYISGVPNPGAKIKLNFYASFSSPSQKILPTGNTQDILQTSRGPLRVSLVHCIDPVVFVKAEDIGLTGYETPAQLQANKQALYLLEEIRLLGSKQMDIPYEGSLPKVIFITPSPKPLHIVARMIVLQSMHKVFAVSSSACLGAAAMIKGTIIYEAIKPKPDCSSIYIEHPSGELEVGLKFSTEHSIEEISIYRTARCIMSGSVYILKKSLA